MKFKFLVIALSLINLNLAAFAKKPKTKQVKNCLKTSTHISNMVQAVDLAKNNLNLILRFEQNQPEADCCGNFTHLYHASSQTLLASAPHMKCFYYDDHLIICLGDKFGKLQQIKVFQDFNEYPQASTVIKVYNTTEQPDALCHIEKMKLNKQHEPMAIIRTPKIQDVLILHIYKKLQYQIIN